MKQLIIILSVITLWLSACNSQSSISIEVDFDGGHSLRKDVYGLNNNVIRKPYYMSNESFTEIYAQLGKPTMRHPGGTISNYINLATGWSEAWEGSDGKDSTRVNTHNSLLIKAGKEENGESIEEYIKFLKSSDAKSTFVMNMTSMNDDEAAEVLQKISEANAEVKYFELGNELYYKQYESAITTAQDYIQKAKSRSNIIKQYFPEALIGILCPSSIWSKEVFLPTGTTTGEREELWYEAIKEEDFYDALVVHMYATVGMNRNVSVEEWIPVEEAYTYGISQIDGKADEVFKRLDDEFPGKKVWVTEYNIGGFSDSLSNYPLRNSYLSGLSTAGFMMKMLKNKNVEMSSWHSLVQMLENETSSFELLPDDTEFEKIQNYEFFKFFKEPLRQGRRYHPVQIIGNQDYLGEGEYNFLYSDMDGFVSFNQVTEKGHLILINKKNVSYILDALELNSKLKGSITKISAINPVENLDLTEAIEASPTVLGLNEIELNNLSLEIKPYSIYKIQFDQSTSQITNADDKNPMEIFPNPATDNIFISTKLKLNEWEILNAFGKSIMKGNDHEINISSLPKGSYIIQTKQHVQRFLKI